VRGLISGQPTDVLSSDQHTVKPWFASRVTMAPQVVDLAAAGFPLIGGRIDVIDNVPLPTLVYQRRQHLISLTEGPSDRLTVEPGSQRIEGYSLLAWREGAFNYVAVSDAAPSELESFSKAFRQATKP
jgi:anti-sigma factor RsiW